MGVDKLSSTTRGLTQARQDTMAPKRKKTAAKASTSKGSKKASDSPKKVKYDPESQFLENRDKNYCKNFSLRNIRVPESSSESEEDLGFVEEEVEFEGFDIKELDRRESVRNKTFILKARIAIMNELRLSDPCESNPVEKRIF